MLSTACASSSFRLPAPIDDETFSSRAVTVEESDVRVSAAIPTAEETLAVFGVDLVKKDIQPIWLEIDNHTDQRFVFLPTGLDPEYFAPLEAAYLFRDDFSDEAYDALADHFQTVSFDHRSPIMPNTNVKGFVLVNTIYPSMFAEIDLVGDRQSLRLDLVVPMPGTEAAQQAAAVFRSPGDEATIIDTEDEDELRAALEGLPCCTRGRSLSANGLPLNLVLVGDIEDIGPAFVRRNYRYRSEAKLYAFGRPQDISARKISRWVVPQPYVIRAWRAPVRFRAHPVLIAQVSMQRGGRFADLEDGSTAVDPSLDVVRNDVVQDLIYSESLAKIGFVKAFGPEVPPDDASYSTDGLRAVLLFTDQSVTLSELDFFDWERLADYRSADRRN